VNLNRKRGWTHKRIANTKLKSTGWSPRFPTFFQALSYDPRLIALALAAD
jgi:hypothetical protein